MSSTELQIAANYRDVHQRIEAACARAGRSASSVKLVAVTKYADIEWVRDLLAVGVIDLGESRPQQLVERAPQISEPVRWHLIGHLQRNKARRVLPLATLIHSVDTLQLLAKIDALADESNLQPRLLLEVNLSGEAAKHGFTADDLSAVWETILEYRHVQLEGLMTMAPLTENPEQTRPVFRRLRELRDQIAGREATSVTLPELSMGMSRDFEIAIEEGATLVRIGSSLFQGLSTEDRE
jgi:pyridoxal phosphate enzyme (YggS family)